VGIGLLLCIALLLPLECNADQIQRHDTLTKPSVDFQKVAGLFPRLKTMVRIKFEQPASLQMLAKIARFGALSHRGGPLEVLGKKQGVFFVRAGNLPQLMKANLPIKVQPLERFRMAGLYRIHFKVRDDDFRGRVNFRISIPRDGFGKKIIHLEEHVSPNTAISHERDGAGNHWLRITLEVTDESRQLKVDCYFTYQVDMADLLDHALAMVPLGEPVQPYDTIDARIMLLSAPKIESDSPRVALLARDLFNQDGEDLVPRAKYRRILGFIKKNLPYDHQKRAKFFGGKMVYTSMDQMYNHPEVTLNNGFAACPSSSVLEAALLRAGGVPARTAGRWGHFYTEIYQPGRGWLSTSVTPTGIPLVRDADYRHLPFVSWEPTIAVQTTKWSGQIRILD
jgi:hypothetical protein